LFRRIQKTGKVETIKMANIQDKDFVEIEYTGKLAEGNIIFDTSDEALAKKSGAFNQGMRYGPIVICVGEHQVIAGLDKNLIGKEVGKDYSFSIPAEDGFGKKDAKLLKLVPTSAFRKSNVQVAPGLQVDIDGVIGTIRTVTGGRVIVDFNHPFAGKDLIYEVKVRRQVLDKVEQVNSLIRMLINQPSETAVAEGAATITLEQELPEEIGKELEKRLIELVKLKSVSFKVKEAKQEAPKTESAGKEHDHAGHDHNHDQPGHSHTQP
jgi:FKBP-type peptidyl-prolyl cis-trans isomerase 2